MNWLRSSTVAQKVLLYVAVAVMLGIITRSVSITVLLTVAFMVGDGGLRFSRRRARDRADA